MIPFEGDMLILVEVTEPYSNYEPTGLMFSWLYHSQGDGEKLITVEVYIKRLHQGVILVAEKIIPENWWGKKNPKYGTTFVAKVVWEPQQFIVFFVYIYIA